MADQVTGRMGGHNSAAPFRREDLAANIPVEDQPVAVRLITLMDQRHSMGGNAGLSESIQRLGRAQAALQRTGYRGDIVACIGMRPLHCHHANPS
jgi:hypothetical protein